MVSAKDKKHEALAKRSKYAPLYNHLCRIQSDEWETTFAEIEMILGFPLPASARLHRPWWGNQKSNNDRSQALAWGAAGWDTSDVDIEGETLVFKRSIIPKDNHPGKQEFNLDEFWPPHDCGSWPEVLVIDREFIYGDEA